MAAEVTTFALVTPYLPPIGVHLAAVAQDAASDSAAASQRLSIVIIALVVLAVLLSVATVVFWRMTRPRDAAPRTSLRWVPPRPRGGSGQGSEGE